ncbi:MAG: hypothetical protein QXT45_07305 [Candidatus Bilamarchaeaceae archaeon]
MLAVAGKQIVGGERMKPPRQPAREAVSAAHYNSADHVSIPTMALKAAFVDACALTGIIPSTEGRTFIQIHDAKNDEDKVEIIGDVQRIRLDNVRNESGVLDLRFRPQFWPWAAAIRVLYVSPPLDPEKILYIATYAGMCGVGAWRPKSKEARNGSYGTFKPVSKEEYDKFAKQYTAISRERVAEVADSFESELLAQIKFMKQARGIPADEIIDVANTVGVGAGLDVTGHGEAR